MTVRLGLHENLGQFSLLLLINGFVGAMIGMERTILPRIGFRVLRTEAILAVRRFGHGSALLDHERDSR